MTAERAAPDRSTADDRDAGPASWTLLADCLQAVGRRDRAAFETLYRATAPRLLRVAVRVCERRQVAEDVLQDAFLSVWENAGAYRRELAAPMTWLTTIVRNRAIDVVRGRKGRLVPLDDVPELEAATAHGPDDVLAHKQLVRIFDDRLDAMPGPQRQTMYLAYRGDLSQSEIARFLDVPLGTVKTWIRRSAPAASV